MTEEERKAAVRERRARKQPWHAPPHFEYQGNIRFIVTAACYEHKPIIGKHPLRLAETESAISETCKEFGVRLFAW